MKIIYKILHIIKKKIQFFILYTINNNIFFYKLFIKIITLIYSKNKKILLNNFFFPYNSISLKHFYYDDIKIFSFTIKHEIPLWNYDYLYNFEFKNSMFYKSISIPKGKADIKVPWEISRLQFLFFFGLLYRTKKEEKYYNLFVEIINDWIKKNPIYKGVNWACTMDVAIRATNMILAYELFSISSDNKKLSTKLLYDTLFLHAFFIKTNLEKSFKVQGNHYLSDIAGLLFISLFLINNYHTKKWLLFSIKEILKELNSQIYNDGTNFEASTCYHRLALELFFYPLFLISKHINYLNFNPRQKRKITCYYKDKVFKLFNTVFYLLKPDGEMPQIGDNDSGQFIKLYPRKILDMRYLLLLGCIFYNNPKWKIKEFFSNEEDIAELSILFGDEGKKKWEKMEWNNLNNISSFAFKDSGWYVMRKNSNYCIVSCGPNGQKNFGGHAHNDKLSFELFLKGKNIIIDPGTYNYTAEPEMRNLFRSTRYHNTVMIDNEEQNRIFKEELFLLGNDTKAKCISWSVNEFKDEFIGEHYGYTRLKDPVTHRRKFIFEKEIGKLVIVDSFTGNFEHTFEWNFILFPGISEKIKINSENINIFKEHCYYSPEYGVKIDTEKITFKIKRIPPFSIYITIDSELNFTVKEK
jgi:hypothetical protein